MIRPLPSPFFFKTSQILLFPIFPPPPTPPPPPPPPPPPLSLSLHHPSPIKGKNKPDRKKKKRKEKREEKNDNQEHIKIKRTASIFTCLSFFLSLSFQNQTSNQKLNATPNPFYFPLLSPPLFSSKTKQKQTKKKSKKSRHFPPFSLRASQDRLGFCFIAGSLIHFFLCFFSEGMY